MTDEKVFWLTVMGGLITNIAAGFLVNYVLRREAQQLVDAAPLVDAQGNPLGARVRRVFGRKQALVELYRGGAPAGYALLVSRRWSRGAP